MKSLRIFTLITCLALTGAVSGMTVVVQRGENATLLARTPGMRDVNRVTLWSRYENGTPVPIFRYCSSKEKQIGCTAKDNDRLDLQLGSENVSVVILDARATDEGTHILQVIGNSTIKETFNVVFTESSGGPSTTASPPSKNITVTVVVIVGVFAVIIIIIIVVVSIIHLYKKKNRKKLDSRDCTVDSEVADTQSSIIEADELNTDASSEEHCFLEKKPEAIQMHII